MKEPYRRGSHGMIHPSLLGGGIQWLILDFSDESTIPHTRRFLIQVEPTLQSLQSQEDTDGNMQITIEDNGPKVSWKLRCQGILR